MPVRRVARTLAPLSLLWLHRAVSRPTGGSLWRSASWAQTVCLTARRVGPWGATTACACPVPPSTTGSKLGDKKAQARMDTACLAWALAHFAGDVAADALSDGP